VRSTTHSNDFSPNPEVNQTIIWLRERGYPPLPIAPAQDAQKYPRIVKGNVVPGESKYCGKNPSYLDPWSIPQSVNHTAYQRRLPTTSELKAWFVCPQTGVATLGGWENTVWIDVDSKHFQSPEHCWYVMKRYLAFAPKLRRSYVEVTQSGGFHIAVRTQMMPTFTHFSFQPGGRRIGEVLGSGRVIVLAPTQGVAGQYRVLSQRNPVKVRDLGELSLHAHSQRKVPSISVLPPQYETSVSIVSVNGLALEPLLCGRVQRLIEAVSTTQVGDRSDCMCAIAREVFGWETWLNQKGLSLNVLAETFCYQVGLQMGLDCDRVRRILSSHSNQVSIRQSMPALWLRNGDSDCWQVVKNNQK